MSRIQELSFQLQNEVQGVLQTAEDVEARQRILESHELSLGTRQQEIATRAEKLDEKEAIQKRNQDHLDAQAVILGKQQAKLDADKKEIQRIEEQRKELGEQQTETKRLLDELTVETKRLEGLQKLDEELKEREAKVTRDIVIDRERKRVLDIRVERIKAREQQLQLDSELSEL